MPDDTKIAADEIAQLGDIKGKAQYGDRMEKAKAQVEMVDKPKDSVAVQHTEAETRVKSGRSYREEDTASLDGVAITQTHKRRVGEGPSDSINIEVSERRLAADSRGLLLDGQRVNDSSLEKQIRGVIDMAKESLRKDEDGIARFTAQEAANIKTATESIPMLPQGGTKLGK